MKGEVNWKIPPQNSDGGARMGDGVGEYDLGKGELKSWVNTYQKCANRFVM